MTQLGAGFERQAASVSSRVNRAGGGSGARYSLQSRASGLFALPAPAALLATVLATVLATAAAAAHWGAASSRTRIQFCRKPNGASLPCACGQPLVGLDRGCDRDAGRGQLSPAQPVASLTCCQPNLLPTRSPQRQELPSLSWSSARGARLLIQPADSTGNSNGSLAGAFDFLRCDSRFSRWVAGVKLKRSAATGGPRPCQVAQLQLRALLVRAVQSIVICLSVRN